MSILNPRMGARKDGTKYKKSGLPKGVWKKARNRYYEAGITINYKSISLGRFSSIEKAESEYLRALELIEEMGNSFSLSEFKRRFEIERRKSIMIEDSTLPIGMK